MNPILPTPHSWHTGHQLASVLKEVQMAPTLLGGVVYGAKLAALRAVKLTATDEVQNDFQYRWSTTKVAVDYPPRTNL
jgi:hypothetical protein